MSYDQTVDRIRVTLCAVFAEVDRCFDRDEDIRRYHPVDGGWSIDEILEHITLTNHYLMLTLSKWSRRALRHAANGLVPDSSESNLDRLDIIGERGTFGWPHPKHMTPTGTVPAEMTRQLLRQQLGEVLIILERLREGRGALCRVTMTVNDLGKIDLYQWTYFIAQHARRHLAQMKSILGSRR